MWEPGEATPCSCRAGRVRVVVVVRLAGTAGTPRWGQTRGRLALLFTPAWRVVPLVEKTKVVRGSRTPAGPGSLAPQHHPSCQRVARQGVVRVVQTDLGLGRSASGGGGCAAGGPARPDEEAPLPTPPVPAAAAAAADGAGAAQAKQPIVRLAPASPPPPQPSPSSLCLCLLLPPARLGRRKKEQEEKGGGGGGGGGRC